MRLNFDPWSARRAALLIALVNAPFWILQQQFAITRPIVSLDLVMAACALAVSRPLGLVLLLFGWALDGVVSQSLQFHFQHPHEFLAAGRFLSEVRLVDFVSGTSLAIAGVFAAVLSLLVFRSPPRRRDLGWLATFGLVIAVLDAFNGSSIIPWRDTRLVAHNLAGSPLAMTGLQVWADRGERPLRALPEGASAADTAGVADWALGHPESSVVAIVVESLGVHRSPAVRQWLRGQLSSTASADHYELVETSSAFRGATTAGELRLLCGLAGAYSVMSADVGASCLPARLAREGWKTFGLHGFSGSMFARERWWSHIGIQSREFAATLNQDRRLPECGAAFRGLCDSDMLELAFERALVPQSFVYLLTLNTHLPLAPASRGLPKDLAALCRDVQAGDDVCQLLAAQGQLLAHAGRLAYRSLRPPLVILVGDHAPPFAATSSREQFDSERVPVFVLRPRRGSVAGSAG